MLLVQKHDRAVCCGCRLLHARFTALASPATALRQAAALGTALTGPLRTLPLPPQVRATLVPSLDNGGGDLSGVPGAPAPALIIEGDCACNLKVQLPQQGPCPATAHARFAGQP